MNYIVYVETDGEHVPYMEPVWVETHEAALAHARRLLLDRPRATSARLYAEDDLVETIWSESICG